MKELLNAGQVLGRSEMKKIMAGSGEQCNCLYCWGGSGGWQEVAAQNCSGHPISVCQSLGYGSTSANWGFC